MSSTLQMVTPPVYRVGPALQTRKHPKSDEICKAYLDGVPVMEIRERFHLNYDRMYQVISAAGIRIRKSVQKKTTRGRLEIPVPLLDILPDIRFLPRLSQQELINRFNVGATSNELHLAFARYITPNTPNT